MGFILNFGCLEVSVDKKMTIVITDQILCSHIFEFQQILFDRISLETIKSTGMKMDGTRS